MMLKLYNESTSKYEQIDQIFTNNSLIFIPLAWIQIQKVVLNVILTLFPSLNYKIRLLRISKQSDFSVLRNKNVERVASFWITVPLLHSSAMEVYRRAVNVCIVHRLVFDRIAPILKPALNNTNIEDLV